MRRRIVLLSAGAVAAAILLATVVTYVVARGELRGGVDDALRALVPRVAPAAAPGPMRIVVPRDPLGGPSGFAQVVTGDGDVLVAGGPVRLPVDDGAQEVARGVRTESFADATIDGTHVRVLTTRGVFGEALQIARPLTEVDDALADLRLVLLLVAVGGVGLAGGLGLLVSRAAVRPVVVLTDEAERVASTQDLSRRVPAAGGDELGRLGRSFNVMLGALERSRTAQRRLVADASHELRTPLTSARTNVEHLVAAPGLPAAERAEVLARTRDQLEDLSVLVGDLVDLARDEVREEEVEEVRLDLLVGEAVARAARLHPAARFALDAPAAVVVRGTPSRLHRAVGNLLDNAVKHGPPDGAVEVRVTAAGEVVVRDHGPGIAPEDLPHVFDRFFRADDARGRPGSGLGLAIVRQVAEEHGGTVAARPAPGGGIALVLALPPTP